MDRTVHAPVDLRSDTMTMKLTKTWVATRGYPLFAMLWVLAILIAGIVGGIAVAFLAMLFGSLVGLVFLHSLRCGVCGEGMLRLGGSQSSRTCRRCGADLTQQRWS